MASIEIVHDTGYPPHTGLIVTDDNNIKTHYDFFPEIEGSLTGDGEIGSEVIEGDFDLSRYDESSGEHNITEEQLADLLGIISDSAINPPDYNLLDGAQCTTCVLDMLADAGIIPDGIFPDIEDTDWKDGIRFNPYTYPNPFDTTGTEISIPIYRPIDPLVLDLNGDGINTIAMNDSNAYFDLNYKGEYEIAC